MDFVRNLKFKQDLENIDSKYPMIKNDLVLKLQMYLSDPDNGLTEDEKNIFRKQINTLQEEKLSKFRKAVDYMLSVNPTQKPI